MGQKPRRSRKPWQARKEATQWVIRIKAAAWNPADLETIQDQIQGEFNLWVGSSSVRLRACIKVAHSFKALREREGKLIRMVLEAADPSGKIKVHLTNIRITMADQWPPAVLVDRRTAPTRRALLFAGIAAVTAIGAVTIWPHACGTRYRTSLGEHSRLTLRDGSLVFLDADSEICVAFTRERRDIELVRGQALFDVKRDRSRPMHVASGSAAVTVLGTEFNLARRQRHVVVAVVDGSVRVDGMESSNLWRKLFDNHSSSTPQSSRTRTLTLSRGQFAEVDGKDIIGSGQADLKTILAWHHAPLSFIQQSLAVVAGQINANSVRQLRIDPSVSGRKISGIYMMDEPESLIAALKLSYPDLAVEATDEGWVIKEAPKR